MPSASDNRVSTGFALSGRLGGGARKRPPMTITSLIDVIFLLLLFFMLATTFSRYQRMEIASSAGAASTVATPPPLVRIAPGPAIDIDGQPVAVDALSDAFARLRADGAVTVLILPRRAATVEDLVTVLSAARAAPLAARLLRRPGATSPMSVTAPSGEVR